jgi:hypothetical protein
VGIAPFHLKRSEEKAHIEPDIGGDAALVDAELGAGLAAEEEA